MTTVSEPSDEDIAKEVLRIQQRDGVCTPQAFVDQARDETSPLHVLFDWDDQTEAEMWRRHKARTIIGRVKVTLKNGAVRTPAHVSVTIVHSGERKRGYVPIEVAMSDDELRDQVFRDARAGLTGWRNRLAAFSQAESAVAALDSAVEFLKLEYGDNEPEAGDDQKEGGE